MRYNKYKKEGIRVKIKNPLALVIAGASLAGVLLGCGAALTKNYLNQEKPAIVENYGYSKGYKPEKIHQAIEDIVEVKEQEPVKPKLENLVNNPFKKSLDKTNRYIEYIEEAAEKNNLDKYLIMGVIVAESNGNPHAKSNVGAVGLMQLMPGTARYLGVKDRKDPSSVVKASEYLSNLVNMYGEELGLAAYNCGPTRVKHLVKKYGKDYNYIEKHLPKETRKYVKKVAAAKYAARKYL